MFALSIIQVNPRPCILGVTTYCLNEAKDLRTSQNPGTALNQSGSHCSCSLSWVPYRPFGPLLHEPAGTIDGGLPTRSTWACRPVRRGPAGPFSLKTAHCAVFRALEPLKTAHCAVFQALEPLKILHWRVFRALDATAVGKLSYRAASYSMLPHRSGNGRHAKHCGSP